MELLANEKILFEKSDQFILTNYRVVKKDISLGKSHRIDIFLENISSIELKFKGSLFLLILALISLVVGFYVSLIGGFILAVIFATIWWVTRKHVISINSNGGSSLYIPIMLTSQNEVNNLIFKIEEAKLNRVHFLYSKNNLSS